MGQQAIGSVQYTDIRKGDKMKAYKVEILVIDHDGLGGNGIREAFEDTKYPNRCIIPDVMAMESADIGEWHDEHPMNISVDAEYARLFGVPKKLL